MRRYPSEAALTINGVSELLGRLDWADRSVALDPTYPTPSDTGYPVRHASASRVAMQFKSPKYAHEERGVCFELTPAGTATLSFREAGGTGYLACPPIEGYGSVDELLDVCRFVAVHAIRTDTSRLFVPAGDGPVTAKIRDATDAQGFDRDPSNYYIVPDAAVVAWEDLATELETGRSPIGIRSMGEPTAAYDALMTRLEDLQGLYPRPDRPNAAPAPPGSLDGEAADRLVEHAIAAYESYYADVNEEHAPDPATERVALREVIDRMRGTRDASLFRVRRSCELIVERGERTADPLLIGETSESAPGTTGGSSDREPEAAVGQETTLSEFF